MKKKKKKERNKISIIVTYVTILFLYAVDYKIVGRLGTYMKYYFYFYFIFCKDALCRNEIIGKFEGKSIIT